MSALITLPPGALLCHLPARFPLARGKALEGAVLAFERQGPAHAPVVVVLGGISAGRHVSAHAAVPGPGWWEGFVGPGLAIDTSRYQVLGFDWLGGCGNSTAPGAGESFPFVATEDQARALCCLLDALAIDRVHAFVGSSYGGMVGLQLAALAPSRVQRLAAIAAPQRSCAQASAWRAVQRGIVELGQRHGAGAEALALARALAMTTYRTPVELQRRFGGAPSFANDRVRFPVQDWLEARGARFAEDWLPEQFLCLCNSIDAHEVNAARVGTPTWLLGFGGDQLVPLSQVRELAAALPQLRAFREVASCYGHDAFLKEHRAVSAFLREVLS
ncbi:MAG TPA: homoserine O-succinyltransferase [Planctomycetota bacterium]